MKIIFDRIFVVVYSTLGYSLTFIEIVRHHWRRLGPRFWGGRGRRVSAENFFCRPLQNV